MTNILSRKSASIILGIIVLGLFTYTISRFSASAALTEQQKALEQLRLVQQDIDSTQGCFDKHLTLLDEKDALLRCAIDATKCPLATGETPAQ